MIRSQEPSTLQLANGVRLKALPFYTVHGVLVPPTILGTQGAGRFQEATLQFVLTCQQATDIASNRDISQGSKLEYPYQVILFRNLEITYFKLFAQGSAKILPQRCVE